MHTNIGPVLTGRWTWYKVEHGKDEGRWQLRGVEMPTATLHAYGRLILPSFDGKGAESAFVAVFHVPGFAGWTGRGERPLHNPAHFELWRVMSGGPEEGRMACLAIGEVPIRPAKEGG